MAKTEPVSILGKLADVTIQDNQFTNTETGEIIEYKRVVLHLIIDGEDEKVELVPAKAEGKSAYKVLKLADEIES